MLAEVVVRRCRMGEGRERSLVVGRKDGGRRVVESLLHSLGEAIHGDLGLGARTWRESPIAPRSDWEAATWQRRESTARGEGWQRCSCADRIWGNATSSWSWGSTCWKKRRGCGEAYKAGECNEGLHIAVSSCGKDRIVLYERTRVKEMDAGSRKRGKGVHSTVRKRMVSSGGRL